jgi:hypothetical protein
VGSGFEPPTPHPLTSTNARCRLLSGFFDSLGVRPVCASVGSESPTARDRGTICLIAASWADPIVELALARRLMAVTGVDGYTATAMVADVHARGADSPHAADVAAAAQALLAPISAAFKPALDEVFRLVQGWADAVARAVKPMFDALAKMEDRR